ncbi:MAG: DNA-protecting protein DprA [Micromonosporaceae bacterium]|nr:DNA-protecting protein DprA [Micromonosporaceae bacterium]
MTAGQHVSAPDESGRETRRARVALACLFEPGRLDLGELVAELGPVEALARVRDGSGPDRLCRIAQVRAGRDIGRIEEHAGRLDARVVIPEDDEWPDQTADLVRLSRRHHVDYFPPLCLWVRGEPRLDEALARSVAVVGARAATEYGAHVASEIGFGLADRGWSVVSGGAYGIDAAAHRGALAAGGVTAAVFACGVDHAYPVGHVGLFERIVDEGGLLVSEWPPGVTPGRHRFLVRNRLIAAVTRGTVVVEAAARSGSRATLHRARGMGRAVMAVPGPVTSAMSVGAHLEVREERARLVTGVAEILEEVGRIGDDLAPVPRGGAQPRDALGPQAAQVLDAVPAAGYVTAEQIASQAGVPISDVLRTMPLLVLAGMVEEVDGRFRLAAAHQAPTSAAHRPTPELR